MIHTFSTGYRRNECLCDEPVNHFVMNFLIGVRKLDTRISLPIKILTEDATGLAILDTPQIRYKVAWKAINSAPLFRSRGGFHFLWFRRKPESLERSGLFFVE
jgi:hypothetical protein